MNHPEWVEDCQYCWRKLKEPSQGLDSVRVGVDILVPGTKLVGHRLVLHPLEYDDDGEDDGGHHEPHDAPVDLEHSREVEHLGDIQQELLTAVHPAYHDDLRHGAVTFLVLTLLYLPQSERAGAEMRNSDCRRL